MVFASLNHPPLPKLPGECETIESVNEYATVKLQVEKGSIKPGANVVIVDDLLATGGTLKATAELVQKVRGNCPSLLLCPHSTFASPFKGRRQPRAGLGDGGAAGAEWPQGHFTAGLQPLQAGLRLRPHGVAGGCAHSPWDLG